MVAAYMQENKVALQPYWAGDETKFAQHIEDIVSGNEWGDHIEIEVMQRLLKRPIIVIHAEENPTIPDNLVDYTGIPIFVSYKGSHYDAFTVREGNQPGFILKNVQNQVAAGHRVTFAAPLQMLPMFLFSQTVRPSQAGSINHSDSGAAATVSPNGAAS